MVGITHRTVCHVVAEWQVLQQHQPVLLVGYGLVHGAPQGECVEKDVQAVAVSLVEEDRCAWYHGHVVCRARDTLDNEGHTALVAEVKVRRVGPPACRVASGLRW
jgi:hypothetical protein